MLLTVMRVEGYILLREMIIIFCSHEFLLLKLIGKYLFEFFELGLYNVGTVGCIVIQVKIILMIIFCNIKFLSRTDFSYDRVGKRFRGV